MRGCCAARLRSSCLSLKTSILGALRSFSKSRRSFSASLMRDDERRRGASGVPGWGVGQGLGVRVRG